MCPNSKTPHALAPILTFRTSFFTPVTYDKAIKLSRLNDICRKVVAPSCQVKIFKKKSNYDLDVINGRG